MKSHSYDFTARQACDICLRPVLLVAAAALALHLAHAWKALPPPHQTLDVDRTIMLHQIEAARLPQDASLVFIGDSSCLMDVDAVAVTEQLGVPSINLGTLSFLDLAQYGRLLAEYVEHHPGQVRAVVVLCHPEALRRHGPKEYYTQFFERSLAGEDFFAVDKPYEYVMRVLGLDLFRDRVETRLLPAPLPREYGRFYGFSRDLYNFMSAHRGGAVDPGHRIYSGDGRYYLAAHQEKTSQLFRETVPPGVTLLIGITPTPQSFLAKAYPQSFERMLEQWSAWIQPDAALSELPASFPDHLCASVTHLTPEGRAVYTQALIKQLRRFL